jgi:hypothetical protein
VTIVGILLAAQDANDNEIASAKPTQYLIYPPNGHLGETESRSNSVPGFISIPRNKTR